MEPKRMHTFFLKKQLTAKKMNTFSLNICLMEFVLSPEECTHSS